MKRLDELFNKARNTHPPLSRKEAEEIIYNAPAGITKAGKISTLKTVLLVATIIIATVGTVVILNTDNNALTESTVVEKHQNTVENSTSLPNKQDKISKDKPAINNADNINNNQLTVHQSVVNTPQLTRLPLKPMPIKKETQPVPVSPVSVKTVSPEKVVIDEVPTETIPVAPVKTEPVPVISIEEQALSTEGIILAANDTVATGDSSVKAYTNARVKKQEPKLFPRILVKTDLAGYVCNSILNRQHNKYGYNAWPYWGNRITMGVELLISRRLGWEVTGTYGFPYTYFSGGGYEPSKPSYESFANYKGWIFSTGIKYFIIKGKNAGAGLFIGPYASIGYQQERVIYFESDSSGQKSVSTISLSKGKSVGYGIFAGYRLIYKNWFIEPLGGLIIGGKDKGYFDKAFFGQDSWARYASFRRIELLVGYKF